MRVRASAKIQIHPTAELIETLRVYQKGLQFCIDYGWFCDIRNNIELHPSVYKQLRRYGLQAQLAIACIKQACGMLKDADNKPIVKYCGARYNFPRSASIKGDVLSLATVKGRQNIPFSIRKY